MSLALVLMLLFMIGVAMLVLGLRGRVISRHPHCRTCRFDLVGAWDRPEARLCPECGTPFRGPRSLPVVRVRRQSRTGLIAVGAALVLIAVTLFASLTVVSGPTISRRMPFAVLRMQADQAEGRTQDQALAELIRRAEAKTLKRSQVDAIVRLALEVQTDSQAPWNVRWGTFIESAYERGLVSPEDAIRYLQQSVAGLDLCVYSPHLSGQSIFPSLVRKPGLSQELKAGSKIERMHLSMRPVGLALDGVALEMLAVPEQDQDQPVTTEHGSFIPGGLLWEAGHVFPQWYPNAAGTFARFPAIHATPGKHRLTLRVEFDPAHSMMSMHVPAFERTYELEIEVVAEPGQWIRLVDRSTSPEGYDAGQRVERVRPISYLPPSDPTGTILRVEFASTTAFRPHAVAGRLLLRDPEGRLYGTTIPNRPVTLSRGQGQLYTGVALTADEWQRLRQSDKVDVLIEPDYTFLVPKINPAWKGSTWWRDDPKFVSPPSFWNDVLEFRDVPLETTPAP